MDKTTAGNRLRARRLALGAGICAVAIASLAIPTWVAGWAPALHWTCSSTGDKIRESEWVPVLYLNAPYGGYGAANATTPTGLIQGTVSGFGSSNGMPASNGTVGGIFFHLNLTVTEIANQTEWGPGTNSRCESPDQILGTADLEGSEVYSGILSGQGGTTDVGEAHVFNFSTSLGDQTAFASNGFTRANSPAVSTCGHAGQWRHFTVGGLDLLLPPAAGASEWSVPLHLSESQTYGYWFPSNFGTWQIDNLSAPGGHGGGWAFTYSPCP